MPPRRVARRTRSANAVSPAPLEPVDPEKVRGALEDLDREGAVALLEEALDVLSVADRDALLDRYFDLDMLRADPPGRLLVDVRAFDTAVREGAYYEGFNVNSRNFMQKSAGTRRFIAECNRLLARCAAASDEPPAQRRAAFELIFALLRRVDEGDDDVFFADEQGSFQVGVAWKTVLPAWFATLAKTAEPEDFAASVVEKVEWFEDYLSASHYAAARKLASPAQRKALLARRRSTLTSRC